MSDLHELSAYSIGPLPRHDLVCSCFLNQFIFGGFRGFTFYFLQLHDIGQIFDLGEHSA
jgi:hypothetical protein